MRVAVKIEISDTDMRGKKHPPYLVLVDDEGYVMASIAIKELAKALAPFLAVKPPDSCYECGGRGVADAHETGDGNGGACRVCDGSGFDPT